MKRFIQSALFLAVGYFQVNGQEMPNLVPPAPETANFFQYLDYPVSHNTGLMQISIPLYEVRSGSLSVPISINYDPSGFKVNEVNGPIAVGWNLMAGGMIARTVKGSVDFGDYPFPDPFETAGVTDNLDLAYLEKVTHFPNNVELAPQGTWLDSEYDIFSYSFPGGSGKLIFEDDGGVKTPVTIPFKPYQITPYASVQLGEIEIVDDQGTYYKFEAMENIGFSNGLAPTGYPLTEIISADKTDTVQFTYELINQKRYGISQVQIVQDNFNDYGNEGDILTPPPTESTQEDWYQVARLTRIDFKMGHVDFILNESTDWVESIEIKRKNGAIVKSISFERSLLFNVVQAQHSLNLLDEVKFNDKTGNGIESYEFEYYPAVQTDGNQLNVRYQDWWGYYNASNESDMIPVHSIQAQSNAWSGNIDVGDPLANRAPNLNAMSSGVLKKVTYPTGGSSEFIYENNKYWSISTNSPQPGPGLRINQIITVDNNGNNNKKTFKYGISESGYGNLELQPALDKMRTVYRHEYFNTGGGARGYFRERVLYSGFVPQLTELASRPIIYTEVTEYNGTSANNAGKIVYEYDYIPWGFEGIGNLKWHIPNYNYWNSSSLVKQRVFKFIGAGSYLIQSSKTNYYSANLLQTVEGLHVQRNHQIPQTGQLVDQTYGIYPESYAVFGEGLDVYANDEFLITSGSKNLTMVIDSVYDDNDIALRTSTYYTYTDEQYVATKSFTTADEDVLTTEYYYPSDFPSDPVFSDMTDFNSNLRNVPILTSEYRNGQHIKSVRTNFFDWGGAYEMFAPMNVEIAFGNNAYEVRMEYLDYDINGNLISFRKSDDRVTSLVWGYGGDFPVIQVEGADYNQIESVLGVGFNLEGGSTLSQTQIDNLRTNLPTAFISTFTYDPFYGMTSQTDANGKTTYYVFDRYGRLRDIRDHRGYILKQYEYNYAGGQ